MVSQASALSHMAAIDHNGMHCNKPRPMRQTCPLRSQWSRVFSPSPVHLGWQQMDNSSKWLKQLEPPTTPVIDSWNLIPNSFCELLLCYWGIVSSVVQFIPMAHTLLSPTVASWAWFCLDLVESANETLLVWLSALSWDSRILKVSAWNLTLHPCSVHAAAPKVRWCIGEAVHWKLKHNLFQLGAECKFPETNQ